MKKILQISLCVIMGINTIEAYTNKSFMLPRPQGINLALENSAGWYELINRNAPDTFGGHLQVAGFYQSSTNSATVGKLFGIKDHHKVSLGTVTITGNNAINNTVTAQDFDMLYLIHTPANNTASNTAPNIPASAGSVSFSPRQTSYGAYINYYQNLDRLLKGLYFTINLPVVRVKNEINFSVSGAQEATLQKYFNGTYQVTQVLNNGTPTIANAQDPLLYGLINANQTIQTGVADMDFTLGYAFWDKRYAHGSITTGFVIPTGNEPKGKYLFEAVIGNGTHYGFGIGGDLWARICGNLEHNFKFFFKTNYRYLFGSTETRTLGLKNHNWGQYHLLASTLPGQNNRAIPAANILTQPVEVTPGNQLDLIAGFSYNNCGLSFDIGYNLYFKERDCVTLRNGLDSNTYAVVARNYDFSAAFTNNGGNIDNGGSTGGKMLSTDDIDVTTAETPRQITHKLFLGGSYRADLWDIPVLFGLGAHGEFASSNAMFNTWGLVGKSGIKF